MDDPLVGDLSAMQTDPLVTPARFMATRRPLRLVMPLAAFEFDEDAPLRDPHSQIGGDVGEADTTRR